jgi:hypothetical protein
MELLKALSGNDTPLRRMLLAIILLGIVGLIPELFLLKHTDSFTQWIPLASLFVGLVVTLAVWFAPGRGTFRAFQVVMVVFIVAGVLGLYLHFIGNIAWLKERDPEMKGMRLVWKALAGATPTLAPGALTQLGMLGLLYAWQHPALGSGDIGQPD